MNIYEDYLNKLDNEILELLTLRKEFKINAKNFKVLELGGHNIEDIYISKLDNEIFNYEYKNLDNLYKLFNENLKISEIYEELNLSRLIKYSYINFLYDYCIYGDDENYELTCKLDRDILIKLSQRVHFGYNVIKLNYLDNSTFYNKLLQSNNSTFILYYLSNFISQPTYLEMLKDKCNKYKICDILICTFYKNIILPYYNEIQLHFCNCIKKNL
jgi:hypothetical protein